MPFAGDLATNVAASYVFEILKRPAAAISLAVQRRDSISRALIDSSDDRLTKLGHKSAQALGDLARVIGSSHGKLTFEVAEYLRELQRTTIPEAIAHATLCGEDASQIAPAFEAFHARFSNMPFQCNQMLAALHAATKERIENVEDKALLEIVRAQHGEISGRLNSIVRSLASVSQGGQRLNINEIKEARLKVAKSIELFNRHVTVETLQGSRKYSLKSLAIPGRLIELEPAHIQSAKIPPSDRTSNYLNFRRTLDRAILLGDPGGGKSTMTQLISYDLANIIGLEAANPDRRDYDAQDLKLPIRIVLRSFEAKQLRVPSYSFFEFIKDEIKVALDSDDSFAARFLSSILANGEAFVIFDGLDEVLDVGARRSMVSYIEQFADIYSGCPILVTSRLVGYRDAPLNESFITVGLARFSLDEIKKYSEKAIRAVGRITLADAKSKAEDFINQTQRIGGDIRENPLMLGLMVQIFVSRGDVPSHRPEVYKECATLMFEKWDGRRDIVADVPRQEVELLDVFGYVASKTFGNARNEEGVAKRWLFEELRNHFQGWFVDRASANKAAKSLVEFLTGRAWVMSEVGYEVFKFTHRTFLEYFFARHLISESESISDLISAQILPYVVNNERVLISHLALHMAIFRDGGKSRQAAECIERTLESLLLPAAQELPFLEFVASALDYILVSETSYVKLVGIITTRAINLGGRETFSASSIIWNLFSTANHRVELATKSITQAISEGLSKGGTPEFLFCAYLIGSRRHDGAHGGVYHYSNPSGGHLWHRLAALREKHSHRLYTMAKKDPELAKAYIYTYSDCRTALYDIHGHTLLENSSSLIVPTGVYQTISMALEIATSFISERLRNERVASTPEVEDCLLFLSRVAADISNSTLRVERVIPPRASTFMVERDVEHVFHNMWSSLRKKKKFQHYKDEIGYALLCAFTLVSHLVDDKDRSKRTNRHREYMAPLGALAEIVNAVSGTKYELELRNWIILRQQERAGKTFN